MGPDRFPGAAAAAAQTAASAPAPEVLSTLAPAVLVALAGALLWLVLGRWYDRVPRKVMAIFVVVVALAFGEVLAGGRVLLPLDGLRGEPPFQELAPTQPHGNLLQGDLIYLVHPLRREVRRAVAGGAWPLWAPRLGGGAPLLADPQAQALQPLATVGLVLSPTAAPGAVAALRTLVALVFAFLLLRRLGAGWEPALAGALAYGLGGFLQLWLGWPLANTAALLPAVLYAVVLVDERGARRDLGLLVASLANLLVAGHPETIAYALALAGGLVALRTVRRSREGAGRRARRLAGRSAGALGIALLLAMPALAPFAEALPETLRWSRLTRTDAEVPAELSRSGAEEEPAAARPAPATRLVQAVAPNALGNSRFVHYWGLRNSNEDAAGFVGTAALLAALLALSGRLGGRAVMAHEGAALGLAGLCAVLLALPAGAGPGDGALPGGLSGRLALPLVLALSLLAAAGLERFRRADLPARLPRAALPAAVALLAVLHLWAVSAHEHPAEPETLEALRRGWLHWHLRFLGVAGLVLALGRRRRWPGLAVAALVAAELLLAHRPVNPPAPRRLAFPETPAIACLAAGPDGTTGGSGPPATRIAAAGRVLLPNVAAVYGLGDVRPFTPMTPLPYLEVLRPGLGRWSGEIPLLDRETLGVLPLFDRLAVARVMTAPGEPCPPGTDEVCAGPDARVCRRPGALPLLRLERSLRGAPDGAGRGGSGADGSGGPARPDGPAWAAGSEVLAFESPRGDPGGDRWSAGVPGAAGGTLTTGIYAAPGWRVLADGRRAEPRGGALLAAELPVGAGRLDLLYRPGGFLLGLLAAALGLALGVAWLSRSPS